MYIYIYIGELVVIPMEILNKTLSFFCTESAAQCAHHGLTAVVIPIVFRRVFFFKALHDLHTIDT